MSGKILIAILAIIVVFLFFPIMQNSVNDFRTDEFTETEASVTNGAVATANITLDQALFDDDINSVVSISSNLTEAGTVTPVSYVASTKVLLVTGLKQGETRTLTLVYDIDALEGETGLETFAPWFLLFFVMAGLGLIVGMFLKRR